MCTYLAQRGSTYYFRRAIPAELRPALGGRAEFMLSLRTKDRAEAKRRVPAHTIATDAELDRARAALGNGPAENAPEKPAERVSARAAALMQVRDEIAQEAAQHAASEADAKQARYDDRASIRRRLERAFTKSTAEITPEEAAARDLVRDVRFALTLEQEQRLAAVAQRAESRRGLPSPPDAANAPVAAPQPVPERVIQAMLDTIILDGWAAERKVQAKTKDAHAAVARWFYERVGRKPVGEISRKDVLEFKAKLIEEGTSLANTKVKLQRLKTLLGWAADNDHASENVASGVTVKDTDKARNKRLPFDLASLNRIFGSPIYTEGARPVQGRGEAAYWLPLLALFTGARLEELGQLRPDDVQQVAYPDTEGKTRRAWFIRIREDDADNLRLKNAGSERDVPVHPELERLGFIAFADAAKAAKQERLFPALKASAYGRLTAKWGEWFGPYIRNACGVTDKRMVFHSFRHTFKDYARHAGIAEGVQRQIMGHSSGDVADQYGSGYPLHQMVAGMAAYRVPGLALP